MSIVFIPSSATKNEVLHIICIYWQFPIVERDARIEQKTTLNWLCDISAPIGLEHCHCKVSTWPWSPLGLSLGPLNLLFLLLSFAASVLPSEFQPSPTFFLPAHQGKLKIPVKISCWAVEYMFSQDTLWSFLLLHNQKDPLTGYLEEPSPTEMISGAFLEEEVVPSSFFCKGYFAPHTNIFCPLVWSGFDHILELS